MSRAAFVRLACRCSLVIAAVSTGVRADVVELKNGGRVQGTTVAPAADDDSLTVELEGGGRLTLSRSQVTRIDSKSEIDTEYQRLARSSPDTTDAHWKLAEWCREHKMLPEMKSHLERILEIDPQHEQARMAAGFRQQNGKWMTRDDVMASRGMVMYDGRYVTKQHVELMERQKETKVAKADWGDTIDRLRRSLTGRNEERLVKAQAELREIRDPDAAEAVVNVLRREKDPVLKRVWLAVASQINHRLAVDALVDRSLADPDEEVRYLSLEYLVKSKRPGLATPYIRALKNRDNEIVNRAAAALGQIGDTDAIGPLIEALITTHKVQVGEGNSDQHAYTFSKDSSAFSFGGGGPKIVPQPVRNPAALNSLVSLSGGATFDYDQEAWRNWLAAQAKQKPIDVRRDE